LEIFNFYSVRNWAEVYVGTPIDSNEAELKIIGSKPCWYIVKRG